MNFIKFLRAAAIFTIVLVTFQEAEGQYAYALSDIVYDNVTKKVTSLSRTRLDYIAGLHYDPAVVGGMFQEGTLLGWSSYTGFAFIDPAVVRLRTTFQSPPDTRFDVLSDHYIVAYFYTDVIIYGDDGEILGRKWYDPLGFSAFGGAADPGWWSYKGSNKLANYVDYQYFLLGRTGRGVVANPTVCTAASMAAGAVSDSCPMALQVMITSRFKPDQDLGATGSGIQQALIGKVQLKAETIGGTSAPITYTWSSDTSVGNQCVTGQTCLAELNQPTSSSYNTITVHAQQVQPGNPPVASTATKSVKIKASLPSLTEYSGTERVPLVTTAGNPCAVGLTGMQNLILGCPDALTPRPSTVNVGGFHTKATAAPPADFISDGSTSYLEFRQIIKPTHKRFGPTVSECFTFEPVSPSGWREDINGRDEAFYQVFRENGFNLRSRFRNSQTGSNANVILEFVDSPGTTLPAFNENGVPLNRYLRQDEFETYVSYYTGLPEDENFGEENRHALSKLTWKWTGGADKRGTSPWRFYGTKYPRSVTQLARQNIAFSSTDDGERDFTGSFREEGEYTSCSAKSPITTTTKRNVAVWRKTNGIWYLVNFDGSTQGVTSWGEENDIPVPGDYDGDGLADFAVFRPDDPATPEDECQDGCSWYIVRSGGSGTQQIYYGETGDKPVPADYDGDGKTDMALFRPSTNTWYFQMSTDGYGSTTFGATNDVPVPSDYDGDGIDDIAVWRASNASWYMLKSGDQSYSVQQWGTSTDKPVIGDYDGDGLTDLATWQTNGDWYILLSATGQSRTVNFGNPATDLAVPGNYDDDDKTDIATYQTGLWSILRSSDDQVQTYNWGIAGDIPVPAAYSR